MIWIAIIIEGTTILYIIYYYYFKNKFIVQYFLATIENWIEMGILVTILTVNVSVMLYEVQYLYCFYQFIISNLLIIHV
jgi:hypothetical protein